VISIPPVAGFNLPFAPDRLFWAVDDDHLLAARIGTADPPLVLSVTDQGSRPAWGDDPTGLPRGTLTAITVDATHQACAFAEQLPIPHDPELFRRLVAVDLNTGEWFWSFQYHGATGLAFGEVGDVFLLARTYDGFAAYPLEAGDQPFWTLSVSPASSEVWCLGPAASPSLLAYGSPPTIVDCTTGEPKPQELLTLDICHQLRWATRDSLLVLGDTGEAGSLSVFGGARVEFPLAAGVTVDRHGLAVSPSSEFVAHASGSELVVWALPGLTPAPGFRAMPLDPASGQARPRWVRYSPDGEFLAVNATPSGPGLTLLEAATGAGLWQYAGDVDRFEFSPSGRRIALCSGDRVTCHDVDDVTATAWTGRDRWERPGIPNQMVLAAIPESPQTDPGQARTWIGVVGAGEEGGGFLYFRRLGDDAPLHESEPDARVVGLTVSPSADRCAVRQSDGKLVARTLDGTWLQSWPERPTSARSPLDAAFVNDEQLVDVRGDKVLRFYNVPERDPTDTKEFDEPLKRVAARPGTAENPAVIAVAGSSRCWLLHPDGRRITEQPVDVDGRITALAFAAPDEQTSKLVIASSNADSAVVLVDTRTGSASSVASDAGIDQVAVSPDGRLLATAAGNHVRVTSLASPEDPLSPAWRLGYPVSRLAFYPTGRALLVATEEPQLFLFDLDDAAAGAFWWGPVPGGPHDLAFTPDGRLLVVACENGIHFYRGRGDE
jgi:WD40 repeat protein